MENEIRIQELKKELDEIYKKANDADADLDYLDTEEIRILREIHNLNKTK